MSLSTDDGVGYIVAVFLTIAIAIIISLILGGYLTTTTESLSYKWKSVGVKVTVDHFNHIELTYIGGHHHQELDRLIVMGINSTGFPMRFYSSANSSHNTPATATPNLVLNDPPVGATINTDDGTLGKDHITVVAEFKDGTKVVVLDVLV
ncbi:hypothetical protein [Archaeoglobus sp.]